MTKKPTFTPKYHAIEIDRIELPYDHERQYIRARYKEGTDMLSGYEVIVLESSDRDLKTDIWRFPRSILSEVNTHRVFSRNSASSRARSVQTTLAEVWENPYVPIMTRNRPGMSGEFLDHYMDSLELEHKWRNASKSAVDSALRLLLREHYEPFEEPYDNLEKYALLYKDRDFVSPHKQIVNRLIEPFMWHEAVVTSSYWDNFITLRTAEDADPAIRALAYLVKAAHEASDSAEYADLKNLTPFHVPFVSTEDKGSLTGDVIKDRNVLMKSAFNAAQVSYHDKSKQTKDTANFNKGVLLMQSGHWSPFEHIAYDVDIFTSHNKDAPLPQVVSYHGNLGTEWAQLRQIVENMDLQNNPSFTGFAQ